MWTLDSGESERQSRERGGGGEKKERERRGGE